MMKNEGTADIAVTARVESIASRENIAKIGAIDVIANMESTVTATASQRLLPACMQDLLIRIILIDATDTVLGDTLVLQHPSKGLNARFANLGLNNGRDTGDARVNAPHSIDQDVRSTRPSSFASDSSWHTSPPDSPLDAPLVPPGGREILEEVSRRTGKYHATVSESIRDDGDNWI
ncbi:hypothetical protein GTA08_BOTSDO00698 [Botryosphaeria dothidea]|uniref:Uncharacterized protein n=1 Tax=Botryosphaeria dothidea TaxID=55169 RepID=A0A8H4J950_9PEZI|nr:hypothetical protein GTA08_BOTSDO00698 [Botryosphaeria dothidea]